MENKYNATPLPECEDCEYRITCAQTEARFLDPRIEAVMGPAEDISYNRSCGKEYCEIDTPTKGSKSPLFYSKI